MRLAELLAGPWYIQGGGCIRGVIDIFVDSISGIIFIDILTIYINIYYILKCTS